MAADKIDTPRNFSYPEFWSILTHLPEDGDWVIVDIPEGTREYDVVKKLRGLGSVLIYEEDGMITQLGISKTGVKFRALMAKLFDKHDI